MPLRIWKIPHFGRVLLCYGVGFGGFWGGVLYGYSLFYGQIYQANPVQVGPCRRDFNVGDIVFDSDDSGRTIDKHRLRVHPPHRSRKYIDGTGPTQHCHCYISRSIAAPKFDILGHVISGNGYRLTLDCLIKVIGVIGADVTTLVSTIFATTNVSLSEQSIVSALVGTSGALFGAVFSALVAALISGLPLRGHC